MTQAPTLTSDDIRLRPHRDSDLSRVVEACADSRTSFWLGTVPAPYTDEHARAYLAQNLEQAAHGEAVHWAVADRLSDLLLGSISLMDLSSSSGPEIGYWIHPDARGRGVATAALGLVVQYAFAEPDRGGLGFGKVRLESAVDNAASRRVAENNHFRDVGFAAAAIVCRDGMHDAIRYARLVTDLAPRSRPLDPGHGESS